MGEWCSGVSGDLGVSGVPVAAWLFPFRILSSVTVNSENNRKLYIYKGINKHARVTEPCLKMTSSRIQLNNTRMSSMEVVKIMYHEINFNICMQCAHPLSV